MVFCELLLLCFGPSLAISLQDEAIVYAPHMRYVSCQRYYRPIYRRSDNPKLTHTLWCLTPQQTASFILFTSLVTGANHLIAMCTHNTTHISLFPSAGEQHKPILRRNQLGTHRRVTYGWRLCPLEGGETCSTGSSSQSVALITGEGTGPSNCLTVTLHLSIWWSLQHWGTTLSCEWNAQHRCFLAQQQVHCSYTFTFYVSIYTFTVEVVI